MKLKNHLNELFGLVNPNKKIKQLAKRIRKLEDKVSRIEKGQRCIFCDSLNVIKQGLRYTKNRGAVQKYHCLSCDKKFSKSGLHERHMRSSSLDIKLALKLREDGLTLSQIAKKLDNRVTRQTVLSWTKKFKK